MLLGAYAMQSNPSVKSNTRSPKPPMSQYPILQSISKDGYPTFSSLPTTR
jgi:hypothetical protein